MPKSRPRRCGGAHSAVDGRERERELQGEREAQTRQEDLQIQISEQRARAAETNRKRNGERIAAGRETLKQLLEPTPVSILTLVKAVNAITPCEGRGWRRCPIGRRGSQGAHHGVWTCHAQAEIRGTRRSLQMESAAGSVEECRNTGI
jgi:hypothetical protein